MTDAGTGCFFRGVDGRAGGRREGGGTDEWYGTMADCGHVQQGGKQCSRVFSTLESRRKRRIGRGSRHVVFEQFTGIRANNQGVYIQRVDN